MIYETKEISSELLSGLKPNNYTRRIKSHFAAYGTGYDFLHFYAVEESGEKLGIISVFNASMMISTFKDKSAELTKAEYKGDKRTEFSFVAKNDIPPLDVNELPKLDDVFRILAPCFPAIKNSYELWLTDTSHRVRRGLSQSFLLGDYTTATIQYIIDGVALVGHVGTIPEERGKFHARQLLYWIGEKLTQDGFQVRLFARPHRVSYYEEIGFKACGIDLVLERIENE